METIFEKLSEYELLNNFFPGIIFCYLVNRFTPFNISAGNEFVNLFVYYFVGMILGRIGSILLEPILYRGKQLSEDDFQRIIADEKAVPKKIVPFAKKTPGKYYYEAERANKTILILDSKANLYRSLASLFFCFFCVKVYSITLYLYFKNVNQIFILAGAIGLFVLFLFAFRKQTQYIMDRCISELKK